MKAVLYATWVKGFRGFGGRVCPFFVPNPEEDLYVWFGKVGVIVATVIAPAVAFVGYVFGMFGLVHSWNFLGAVAAVIFALGAVLTGVGVWFSPADGLVFTPSDGAKEADEEPTVPLMYVEPESTIPLPASWL